MKIVSYNINGLNAFVNNGKMDSLLNDHPSDVYCFQEVKMNNIEKISAKAGESYKLVNEGYCHVSSVNKLKNGYAGVMTMYNDFPNVCSVVEEHFPVMESSNENYIYVPGRIITVEFKDYFLVNVYVVNSGKKDELRKEWDKYFINYLNVLQVNKPIVVVGDFNVCATEYDYWGKYQKAINSGPGLMQYEIDDFNELINECNLVDAYRYKHGNERKYSWYSPMGRAVEKNHGWRIDYALVSESLKDKIIDCDILDKYQAPDHCPIYIELS